MESKELIDDAIELLMQLRIKTYSERVNEQQLYKVQMLLYEALDKLRQPPVSGSLPSQKELIELIKEMHKYSLYKISEQDDRPTHLPHWLFDKVEMVIGNDR